MNLKKVKCGPNQHCVARDKDHECLCNPGYEKTLSYETLGCSNIDECLSRTHTCVANSFCIDTEGSFECECEPGFEGYPEVEVGFSWYRTLRPSFTFKFETDDTETPSKLITGFS